MLGLRRDFEGQTVLITAGPTREDIDPVRFLTNRSSGKMGYALAEAALRRGARTILVSGPTDLPVPEGAEWIPVRSTEEMRSAVNERASDATRYRDGRGCRRLSARGSDDAENQARGQGSYTRT